MLSLFHAMCRFFSVLYLPKDGCNKDYKYSPLFFYETAVDTSKPVKFTSLT